MEDFYTLVWDVVVAVDAVSLQVVAEVKEAHHLPHYVKSQVQHGLHAAWVVMEAAR